MRAVIVGENYVAGGADKMTKILCEQLGFEEVFLFINHDDDFSVLCNPELPSNVKLIKYKVPTLAHIGEFVNSFNNRKWLFYPLKALSILFRYPYILFLICYFYFKFKSIDLNVCISNNGGYPGGEINRSATIAASLLKRCKVFHIVHNMPTKSPKILSVFENFYDYILQKRAVFICDSNAIVNQMKKIRNFKQELKVVYLGAEEVSYEPRSKTYDKVKLLSVASLDDRKNQLFLLEAIYQLSKIYPNKFTLTLIGSEGELGYKAKLKDFVQKNNLSSYIEFIEFTPNIHQYFASHDIFVLPSRQEGFPLVNLMAMNSSMPVISTRAGGTDEQVFSNINGYIIEQEDLSALIDALSKYLENNILIQSHGEKSLEIYNEHFTFQKMIENYQSLFYN